MNMVRAAVVEHPAQWEFCGYKEIQNPRQRKGIIDFDRLVDLLGFETYDELKDAHYKWVESAIQTDKGDKKDKWTRSIAVGSKTFVEKMKEALRYRARGRKIICTNDTFELRELLTPYGKANILYSGNTLLWDQPIDRLRIYRPSSSSLIGQFLLEN